MGQNESGGAKQVTRHFICTPNLCEPKVISLFLFSHWHSSMNIMIAKINYYDFCFYCYHDKDYYQYYWYLIMIIIIIVIQ